MTAALDRASGADRMRCVVTVVFVAALAGSIEHRAQHTESGLTWFHAWILLWQACRVREQSLEQVLEPLPEPLPE